MPCSSEAIAHYRRSYENPHQDCKTDMSLLSVFNFGLQVTEFRFQLPSLSGKDWLSIVSKGHTKCLRNTSFSACLVRYVVCLPFLSVILQKQNIGVCFPRVYRSGKQWDWMWGQGKAVWRGFLIKGPESCCHPRELPGSGAHGADPPDGKRRRKKVSFKEGESGRSVQNGRRRA